MRRVLLASSLAALTIGGSACVVNVDRQGYIEHDEKRFDAEGVTDLHLDTFAGNIEVRSWDRPEIVVDVEKRGADKAAVGRIDVTVNRSGNRIEVTARHSGPRGGFVGIGSMSSPAAKLIATVPRKTDLVVRTSDGSLLVERVEGKLDIRTSDGRIHVIETSGELLADTSDGSVELEDVAGRVDARTSDGSLRVSGTPSQLRAETGDGSVVVRVRRGVEMTDDWLVTTGDGSISVELPDGFNADIEADPGSDGRTRNDLALINVSGGTREQRLLRGRLGNGGHLFRLRTGDGTIRLTKY
jgi:putative adhesin